MLRQVERFFHVGKDDVGERHFFGPVHLGFHNINRPMHRIAAFAREVMLGDQRGDHRIHKALIGLVAVTIQNCGIGHQVADIADPQQRAALQRHNATIRCRERAILAEATGHSFSALFQLRFKIATHKAKPVCIGQNFVFSVDAGHGIFAIHDR